MLLRSPRRKGIAQALNRLIDAQTGKKLDLGQWEVWKERAELTIRGVPANGVSRQTKTSLVASTTSKLPAHTEDDESAHVQDPVDLDFSKEDHGGVRNGHPSLLYSSQT